MGRGIHQRQKPGWQKVRKPLGRRPKLIKPEERRPEKHRKERVYGR